METQHLQNFSNQILASFDNMKVLLRMYWLNTELIFVRRSPFSN